MRRTESFMIVRTALAFTIHARDYRVDVAIAPIRAFVRGFVSRSTDTEVVPVFFLNGEDSEETRTLIHSSLKIIEQQSPFWAKRIRACFRSILCLGGQGVCGFSSVDKCCTVNPGKVQAIVKDPSDAAICLAANIVYAACVGYLSGFRRGPLGILYKRHLCCGAAIRFLERCLPLSEASDIEAWIMAFRTYRRNHKA